jgi:hypothetical protein
MVHSLHFIDFISWAVLDNRPLYCITLWRCRLFIKIAISAI